MVLEHAEECVGETRGDDNVGCQVLYAHILDLLNFIPLTPQQPAECASDLARGRASPEFPGLILYPSHGFVEYRLGGNGNSCDDALINLNFGVGEQVNLSKDHEIHGYWYLSTDVFLQKELVGAPEPGGPLPKAGIMPCVTLEMAIEVTRKDGTKETLAAGQTTKTMVTYSEGYINQTLLESDPCPSATGKVAPEDVTEFHVVLETANRSIERFDSFTVNVDWYQHDATHGGPAGAQNHTREPQWNQHTGRDHPNRIVLPIEDPLKIYRLELLDDAEEPATRVDEHNNLSIRLVTLSPFGQHDVDVENVRFQLFDEVGTEVPLEHLGNWSTPRDQIDGFHLPWRLIYPWEMEAEDLPPGTYSLRATVPNWQHTSQAEKEITITIEREDEVGSLLGLPPLVFAVSAFALAGWLERRRTTK